MAILPPLLISLDTMAFFIFCGKQQHNLLHVSSVAEIESTLVGSLVGSVLEGDDSVSGSQLLLRELAFILLGFLGSNRRLTILGCLRDK